MRLRILVVGLLLCPLCRVAAQDEYTWDMGGAIGGSFYMGDANYNRPFKNTGLAGSLMARRVFNPRMAVKINLGAGHISGDTRSMSTVYPEEGQADFSRTLFDLGAQFEYNFWGYGVNSYRGDRRFTPYVLAGMVESWGGECVDYPERRHCCGFGFRNYLVQANRGYSIANSHKKLESMAPYKPDFIVANCPGCAMFLDKWQYAIAEMEGTTYGENGHGIPVLTYEEMAGLVLGYDPWELGMQMHQVDVEPLLDKMGVEYDPAAKYLGRNGKYIGQPASAVVNCGSTDTVYDIRE